MQKKNLYAFKLNALDLLERRTNGRKIQFFLIKFLMWKANMLQATFIECIEFHGIQKKKLSDKGVKM